MLRIIASFIAGFVLFAGTANAETYRLSYQAAVLGVVTFGEARYEITASPQRYAVRATLRTSGAARLFDQTDISATSAGSVSGPNIMWSRYDLSHSYANKFRRVRLNRAAGAVTADVNPRFGNPGDPPATTAQQRNSYDPLTGLFALGRQVGVARACRGGVLVFDGRAHYRLSVTPRSQGTFNGGGYNGAAVSCNFRYEPIAGFNMTAQERARIPVGEAWFALTNVPGFAPLLRLTVPTPIGPAQLDLRTYEQVRATTS